MGCNYVVFSYFHANTGKHAVLMVVVKHKRLNQQQSGIRMHHETPIRESIQMEVK